MTTTTDIQFLKELQQQLQYESEHDYDMQASPRFWVIRDYRTVPGAEDYDNGYIDRHHNDGDYTSFKTFEELSEFIQDYIDEEDIEEKEELFEILTGEGSFDDLWEYAYEKLNDSGYYYEVFVKDEAFLCPDTMFLTKEEAKSHLQRNDYHYTSKAHTYAMTAWRAPKVERLLKILNEVDWDTLNKKEALT